jgi:hypothetical protein
MPVGRPGAVVGLAACIDVTVHNTDAVVDAILRINNSDTFIISSPTITGTGKVTWSNTQERNIDTFSAADVVQLLVETTSGSINFIPEVAAELEFDN